MISWPIYAGRNGVTVEGRIEARGGSQNDIEVFIVDSDGLTNLSNGNQTPIYYRSGVVTVANIGKILGEGTYHLVFSNRRGWTSRNVYGNVSYRFVP